MANPQAYYKDDEQNDKEQDSSNKKNLSFDINKDKNNKKIPSNFWKNLIENSPLALINTLAVLLIPLGIFSFGNYLAERQSQEKSLAEYVEFVKNIFFDVYYSNSKDPRIPAVSVSNFISSKTVTTLKNLENSKQQKELLDFLKQAKIGFLPISRDPKFEDIPDEIIKTIENEYDCPMDYKPDKQSVTPDEDGKAKIPHPRITNPCLLTGINLESINLNGQDLKFVVLKKAKLRGTRFNGAELQYANFMEADLSQVEMKKAYLSRANFEKATLRGAKFNGADLRGANFNGANLKPIENREGLILTNFTGADLSQVEMKKAYLGQANFEKATLGGAKFNGADLRGANFNSANLEPIENSEGITLTDLTGAILDGADFTLANLRGAIFSNLEESKTKITLCQTILPDGHIANPDCKP